MSVTVSTSRWFGGSALLSLDTGILGCKTRCLCRRSCLRSLRGSQKTLSRLKHLVEEERRVRRWFFLLSQVKQGGSLP